MASVSQNLMDFQKDLDEAELEQIYAWIDEIPLSRPKRNIGRDFSDGVMVAEILKHFLPQIICVHNYPPVNGTKMKMVNWYLLNRKVFPKLNFTVTEDLIREICVGKAGLIERFLLYLRSKIERAVWDLQKEAEVRNVAAHQQGKATMRLHGGAKGKGNFNDKPEADQNLDPVYTSPNAIVSKEGKPISKNVSPSRPAKFAQAGPYKGNARIKVMDETVTRTVYEEKEQECLAKEETIQILQAKVRRLEHLLHLKDIRIEDLQQRMESSRPTGLAKR